MFYVFILMTDSDYSQEVNTMNEHDISNDHSFTTTHLSQVICDFESLQIFQLADLKYSGHQVETFVQL